MINIERNELLYLLEKKRKIIERPKHDGLGEIIAGLSLMVTLALGDYSNLPFESLYFKIVLWAISIIILVFGIYTLLKNKVDSYTIEKLFSEIVDLDPQVEHPFSIVIIRSQLPEGKYLVFKSKRWGCWLFPNYHCSGISFNEDTEIEYVIKNVKRDLNEDLGFKYIGDKISHKYSEGDKVMKKYHFFFFHATGYMHLPSRGLFRKQFNSNGKKYCWKTLDQLYSHSKTFKRNKDVLDYIRNNCDIS